jgi:hypothetical protein
MGKILYASNYINEKVKFFSVYLKFLQVIRGEEEPAAEDIVQGPEVEKERLAEEDLTTTLAEASRDYGQPEVWRFNFYMAQWA